VPAGNAEDGERGNETPPGLGLGRRVLTRSGRPVLNPKGSIGLIRRTGLSCCRPRDWERSLRGPGL